jgi:putative ABC transport system permease protein
LFIKQFLLYAVLAVVISTPVIIWLFRSWLKQFAHQTDLRPAVFIITFFGVILVTILTVLFHSIKASRLNPVNSLRYE